MLVILYITTLALGLNSAITCLQAPQGGIGDCSVVATTTTSISRSPWVIALNTAILSAHIVSPYDEFSTLTPGYIEPLLVMTTEATLIPEYGAYAFEIIFSHNSKALRIAL